MGSFLYFLGLVLGILNELNGDIRQIQRERESLTMTKYIFVTGGVVSSIGKGIVAASLGRLLKNRGLKVAIQKFDPYINVDPGMVSPYQHGEVFVTDDGSETDLDLGHYERFVDINLNKYSNLTTGEVYSSVISKERRGEYEGATVQVIPHVTNEIKDKIMRVGQTTGADIVITEVGGTVGDIEIFPFIEALRQMKSEVGSKNVLYIHTTLIPYLKAAGELKTKPTQHSVKELRGLGIQPNLLVVRTEENLPQDIKEKLALFCDVNPEAVIESRDVETLYSIPLRLKDQKMDEQVVNHFGLDVPKADMEDWKNLEHLVLNLKSTVTIGLVGKYVELPDAYLSAIEALKHAGYVYDADINVKWINSEEVTSENVHEHLADVDGVLVPSGFGERGIEGKIAAITYAREHKIPFFGISLGIQLAAIDIARNVAGIEGACSQETHPEGKDQVVILNPYPEAGETLRLGLYPIDLKEGSRVSSYYLDETTIQERHRNRYEINEDYRQVLEENGLQVVGESPDGSYVEIVELKGHPFFIATQFHPEFVSRPDSPHPLIVGFVEASMLHQKKIQR